MKKYYYFAAMAFAAAGLASCSEDKNEPDVPDTPGTEVTSPTADVYILNQGNFYNGIEGGLSTINYADKSSSKNVFKAANKRSLGDTPQCGVAYGSKIYVGTSASNTIEIMDRGSYLSYKQIKLSENPENGTSPYSMVAHNGKVYISMYDGYLARLDTLTMTIDKSIPVGANPDQIALYKNKIYVPISEGMNWPNYGTTACMVDPETMTIEKTFTVGLNPTQFLEAGGSLYCLCKGNYGDVASKLYQVNSDFSVREVCPATIVASYGENIAVIDQPFVEGDPIINYSLYNPATDTSKAWDIERPDYANNIFYDAENDRLLISSYVMNGIYPSYDMPGYVNVYDGTGRFVLFKADLGAAGPACIFTHQK